MIKYGATSRSVVGDGDGDNNAGALFASARRADDNNTYQPLDEIQLTRDFRASLILTQLGTLDPPPPASSSPASCAQVDGNCGIAQCSDTKPTMSKESLQHSVTPPLSPSSSTSEVRGGGSGSGSSRSNSELVPPPLTRVLLAKQQQTMASHMKGDEEEVVVDFHDIASGPPIIPMSKSPSTPLSSAKQHTMGAGNKGKSIFESDDDASDDEDLFFQDFSSSSRGTWVRHSRRASNKSSDSAAPLPRRKARYSKFDLAAFASHLHANRLSVMQLRESNIRLSEDEERELLRLLEKRKSMAASPSAHPDSIDTHAPPPPAVPPLKDENIPDRPVSKKPSLLLRKIHLDQDMERKKSVRRSLSMDAIHQVTALYDKPPPPPQQQPEPSPSTSANDTEPTTTLSSPVANAHPQPHAPRPSAESAASISTPPRGSRSIGLFGSLRQAKRAAPFRGLVRNLSNAGSAYRNRNRSGTQQQQQQQQQDGGLTPAAMAVMQHDKQINATSHDTISKDDGGLLTHLLAKAGKATKRSPATKTVNMQHTTRLQQRKDKGKSRVVRRTIIYVPPDSLNFMKHLENNGGSSGTSTIMPPLPHDMLDKIRQVDRRNRTTTAAAAAAAATTSTMALKRSKAAAEPQDDADTGYYDDESLYGYYQSADDPYASSAPQLQGLEVREMDDGTVEWGIVKKQGNRKSFYAHDNTVEHSRDDEEGIEEHLLEWMKFSQHGDPAGANALSPAPPPIPRRSPRRRIDSSASSSSTASSDDHRRAKHISTITKDSSTIDVYFAPQQTLPSLLQMIADSTKEEDLAKERELELQRMKQASVEEQLDEVMRSFQQ